METCREDRDELPLKSMSDLLIEPTGAALGAYVSGVDVSQCVSETNRLYLQGAFWEHSVLVFRDQELNEEQQVTFSRVFCDPVPHPTNVKNVGKLPEICVISNVEEDGQPIGALGNSEVSFHSDLAFCVEAGTVSVLYAVEAPSDSGQTFWASGIASYDALDAQSRERLESVSIVYGHAKASYRSDTPVSHPAVITHPESGRKSRYFSSNHAARVVDENDEESESLIARLRSYTTEDRFVWMHGWQPGDLVIWDNRTTQHRRTTVEETKRRLMRRTQAVGFPEGDPAIFPKEEA